MLSRITLCCLMFLALNACSDASKIEFQGQTMGTQYHIIVVNFPSTIPEEQILKTNIDNILETVNQQMSTYLADSELSKFNQYNKTDWFPVSKELLEVVKAAQQLSRETHGAFDISISPLVELWGFGPEIKYQTPDPISLQEVKRYTGYQLLEAQNEPAALRKQSGLLQIDLSAIAKGYAVDKISQYLSDQGITNYLVEIGGEVRTQGVNLSDKKWRIAIQSPELQSNSGTKVLELSNQAVATSGDYRNYYIENGQRLSHIISPETGYPVKHKLASVTVLHDSAMLADAYATALMVMGEEQGKQFAKAQTLEVYMIIRDQDNYRVWQTLH